jgi:hypothetical protein
MQVDAVDASCYGGAMRYLVLAVALLALAAPAAAAPLHGLRTPPYVTVVHASCPDAPLDDPADCADTTSAIVYLMSGAGAFARQHELGHLYDAQFLDDTERAAITPLLGAGGPWDQGTGDDCGPRGCPSEKFADAYATCRLGLWPLPRHGVSTGWEMHYDYAPSTNKRQTRVCSAIRAMAR